LALLAGLAWLALWGWGLEAAPAQGQSSLRSGESRVAVPNVRGKRQAEAERILEEAGFSSIQVYDVDTDKRGLSGVVKEQLPPPGRELPVSTIVKLSVYRYDP
jgi:beta-lactam-binding protein with PASTA domain